MRTRLALILCLPLALTGCMMSPTAAPSPDAGLSIQGMVHGGQQPISGAKVYLLAANTTGYGGIGFAPTASNLSTSLLGGPGYVVTASDGTFTLSSYSCTPNTQVYLYAVGGNPGLSGTVNNTAAGLLAALGNCPSSGSFVTATPYVIINEVSTIAAAYAFAGFATDATHVSSSGTALAKVGIQNAFANAGNLAMLSNGTALAATPGVGSQGIVPQDEIYALADILGSCVNTDGTQIGGNNPTTCYTLLHTATSDGTPSGTVPADTATAAINIAHNPGANVSTLFGLIPASPAFATSFAIPNDFTIGIQFAGGGLNDPYAVAIDGGGNVWSANNGNKSVSELSSIGVPLSPASGYSNVSLNSGGIFAIAIDPSGNAWVPSYYGSNVTEFPGTNSLLSGPVTYTPASVDNPYAIAIDGTGNAWVTNYSGTHGVTEITTSGSSSYTDTMSQPVSLAIDGSQDVWIADHNGNDVVEFSNAGTLLSSPKYSGGGLNVPYAIAIDNSGNAWIANEGGINTSNITELQGITNGTVTRGTPISPSGGYTVGGISAPYAIAIDGAGNVWAANVGAGSANSNVSELSNSGAALSPSTGYQGGLVDSPDSIAVDGSGNVWIANPYDSNLNELIGVAAPVVTPLSVGSQTVLGVNHLGARP